MKKERIFPQVLLFIALISGLIFPAFAMAQGQATPMVAAGFKHTIGLKSNGTLVATGDNNYGQCDVSGWTDIAWVATGSYHTVGLKSDGTVVAAGLEFEPVKWNLTETINWPLIGGIMAGVVAAGLVVFFVHRRRTG